MKLTTKSILSTLKNIGFYFAITLPLLGQSISISATIHSDGYRNTGIYDAIELEEHLLLDNMFEIIFPLEGAQINNLRLFIANQAIDPERRARLAATFFQHNLELIGYEDTLCKLISNELVSAEIRADLASSFLKDDRFDLDYQAENAVHALISNTAVSAECRAQLANNFLFYYLNLDDPDAEAAVLSLIRDENVPITIRAQLATRFLVRYPTLGDSATKTAALSLIKNESVPVTIRAELAAIFLVRYSTLDDPAAKAAILSLIRNTSVPATDRVRLAMKFLVRYSTLDDSATKIAVLSLIRDTSIPAKIRAQLANNFLFCYSNLGDSATEVAVLSLIKNTCVPAADRAELATRFLFRFSALGNSATEATLHRLIRDASVPAPIRAYLATNFLAHYPNLTDPAAKAAIISLIKDTSVPAADRANLARNFLLRNLPLDVPTTETISSLISNNDLPTKMQTELNTLLIKAKKPTELSAAATVAPGVKRYRDNKVELTNNLPATNNANQPTDTPSADANNDATATTATSLTNTVNNIQPVNDESNPSNLKTEGTVTPMVQSTANADSTPAKEYTLFLTFIKKISSIRQLIASGSYNEEEVKKCIKEIQTEINNNVETLTSAQLQELNSKILLLNHANDEAIRAKVDTTKFSLEQEEELNYEYMNFLYKHLVKIRFITIPSTLLLGKQFLMPKFHQKYRHPSF